AEAPQVDGNRLALATARGEDRARAGVLRRRSPAAELGANPAGRKPRLPLCGCRGSAPSDGGEPQLRQDGADLVTKRTAGGRCIAECTALWHSARRPSSARGTGRFPRPRAAAK